VSLVQLFKGVDNSRNLFAVLVCHIEEIDHLINRGVFDNKHVLRQGFNKGQETPLSIVPSICIDLT
jgi:hypothetical protein